MSTDAPPATPSDSVAPRAAGNPGTAIPYERFLDCVHCGLCTSACPTYLETGDENDSPRGRIYLMRAVTDGRLPLTPAVERHLDLCLDCRSCETACPSGVQYGRLIEPFRVGMRQRPAAQQAAGWFQYWILYGLFPYPRRLRWALLPARWLQQLGLDRALSRSGLLKLLPQSLRRMQALLPPLASRGQELPEFLPARGTRRARVALFTGCVGDALFHRVNRATALVLQHNGCDVLIPRSQGCCGAIHYHSGAGEPALEAAQANLRAFGPLDVDALIVNVAGCGSMLKDYGHMAAELASTNEQLRGGLDSLAGKIRDVHEFLHDLGPLAPSVPVPLTAVYHDACHLCHAQQIRAQPRALLARISGLKLVPLPESEVCCGAAGSYNLTEPEMADRLGRRKVEHLLGTGAACVITGNAGCSLQIQMLLRERSRGDIPVVHPLELLARSYGLE